MGIELTRGQRWIYGQLVNSPSIAQPVFEYPAPQAALPPYILIDFRGASDLVLRGLRAGVIAFYSVVAVGENTPTLRLEPTADAIDDALQGQTGSSGDVAIQTCARTQTLLNASIQSGDNRRSLGGLYKLNLAPLTA